MSIIRTQVFPTRKNLERERCNLGARAIPYTVPILSDPDEHGKQVSLNHQSWYISFKFLGADGRLIEVLGPMVPFICAKNPKVDLPLEREGLLYPLSEERARGRYIFGAVSILVFC